MSLARATLRPSVAALVTANLAAMLLAVWPWLPRGAHPGRPAPAPRRPEAPVLASLPPLAAFSETTARPLFTPTRRPAPTAQRPGPVAIESRYRLQGLVIAGTARRALVAEFAGGRRFEVGEGDTIDGWTVARISPDAITFASPLGETTLKIIGAAAAVAAPPRR